MSVSLGRDSKMWRIRCNMFSNKLLADFHSLKYGSLEICVSHGWSDPRKEVTGMCILGGEIV